MNMYNYICKNYRKIFQNYALRVARGIQNCEERTSIRIKGIYLHTRISCINLTVNLFYNIFISALHSRIFNKTSW